MNLFVGLAFGVGSIIFFISVISLSRINYVHDSKCENGIVKVLVSSQDNSTAWCQ